MLRKLRLFEKDCDSYEQENKLETSESRLLPPRQSIDTNQSMDEELVNSSELVQRPARLLIDTLNDMPRDLLKKVSDRS